jgi:hypothetical protein
VRFEKARGIYGDDVREIEAFMVNTACGQSWSWKDGDGATLDRVVDLAKLGMSGSEIAGELGIHKSNVSRALKKARETGQLPPEERRYGKA